MGLKTTKLKIEVQKIRLPFAAENAAARNETNSLVYKPLSFNIS